VTLKGLDPYGGNKAIPFEVRYTTSWTYNEIPIFLAVGAAGGVLGALFTGSVRLWSSSYRQLGLVKRHPVIDVLLVALATALTSFWNKYLRFGTAELLSQLMTPYMQTPSMPAESSGSSPTEEVADTLGSLGIALLIKFALTVITFGTQIPQGIYMPSMAIGAMLGRFIGQSAHVLVHNSTVLGSSINLEPAVYTMAGAGAVMAAVTRWHFTVVAIVFELSRSWTYIVPFTLAIYTAKASAAYLEPQGIYVSLQHARFTLCLYLQDLVAELHAETSLDTILKTSDTKIEDCLEAPNSQTPAVNLISEFVTQVHILRTLLDDTEAAGIHALPVLKQTTFIGCVSTSGLREILAPLDDYLQVALTQGASKTLDINIVHGATDSRNCDFGTAEEQSAKTYAHLIIDYPAIFDSCSTLLSLYTYFKNSDVEYVCVRRWGMFRTVVSNPLHSVDLLLTTVFDANHPRKLVSEYIERLCILA
jgi:chloride channel 3/4/5